MKPSLFPSAERWKDDRSGLPKKSFKSYCFNDPAAIAGLVRTEKSTMLQMSVVNMVCTNGDPLGMNNLFYI